MTYYLYDHPNSNAPERANGGRFWGYPTRRGTAQIQALMVHTPEVLEDWTGGDDSAEAVARYFATTTRPASTHYTVDADSVVACLPPEAEAFQCGGKRPDGVAYNSLLWGAEIGYRATSWGTHPDRDAQIIRHAATVYAPIATANGIPLRVLTRAEFDAGHRGFVAHATLDPTRRTDPGPAFPWTDLFDAIDQQTGDDMWQYIIIDEALIRHAFAQGWATGDINYWLGKLANLADPEWDNFRRAVTNGLVRSGGVTPTHVSAAVAAHARLTGDKDGIHPHDHKVTITQDIAGTAV